MVEPLACIHSHCFQCSRCQKKLTPLNYKMVGGIPYCEPICQNVRVEQIVNESKQTLASSKSNVLQFIPSKMNMKNKQSYAILYQEATNVNRRKVLLLFCLRLCCFKFAEIGSRNSFIVIERTMNNHTESGRSVYAKNSQTPPMKRITHFQSRHNSMKNLSKIGSEHHCFVCGKTVYPAVKLRHKSRIYHDTCIRCEMCDQPLTVDTMHMVKGMVLCSKHSSSIVAGKGN
ncbi:hypothetical protein FBUS_07967 [Fasciolopsis buskii]|uniref:LIM zinc-binding domain-containing protein n=1 Tax=Fasciolopsis buskii TaxID=27845 RepID=A0A8E0VGP3_9TREM|nr:hypothetical protein FBUS_07967 [Fasciolopsis buski]